MGDFFTKKTFEYFASAAKSGHDKAWLDANRAKYNSEVREPMEFLLTQINETQGNKLPKIDIKSSKITRPLRSKSKSPGGALVKDFTHFSLCEKQTSMFEWNPTIHFQLGLGKEDNFIGIGLYMVSSRQLGLVRNAFVADYQKIHKILNQKELRKRWGDLQGEMYSRFPRGFEEDHKAAEYLWHKQFYLSQSFSRTEVCSKSFADNLSKSIEVALPFYQWIRKTVGIYEK